MADRADFSGVAFVVEDDAENREFLGAVLGRLGFSVRTADRASSALEGCSAATTQIVLAKLHLPDMSALELVRALRTKALAAPILLLSDAFSREELEDSVSLAGVHCLTLPIRLRSLIEVLDRLRSQDPRRIQSRS